jgi:hypothetical protein
MSFDGDLQHLPIVDVIQLLHATGKSGTLTLRSLKGESQLVFNGGYIVSANHVNNSVRIGQILMDMGIISHDDLEGALNEQQKAGALRKPIIQTLIEAGKINPDEAYQGLEVLIEMTIVEVLSWTRGTFSLDVERIAVSDEYRYFPEQLKKEIQLNTQSVLMDALRIYDERKRDGQDGSVFGGPPEVKGSDAELSAADLGLDELDNLERKIPQAFTGLSESEPETPAKRLQLSLAGVPAEDQQRLFRYLEEILERPDAGRSSAGVILYSGDKVLRECVAAVCGSSFLCATTEAAGLDPIIDQFQSKGRSLLLLLDPGEPTGKGGTRSDMVTLVRQKCEKYPELPVILLACPWDFELITRAYQSGVRAVIPRASRTERKDSFITDTIDSSQALDGYLQKMGVEAGEPGEGLLQRFKEQAAALSERREPSDVTYALLQAVASYFPRAMTLVVVRSELMAERGIGISGAGETSSIRQRFAIPGSLVFQKALEGESFYGDSDGTIRETVKGVMGEAASPKILLLPVKSFGRVIALIYADFGPRAGGAPQLELLEILAQQAGLVIDNALYRKRCAQK